MERPWSYYLLLVVAWLGALWGLWLTGEAWLTWPVVDSAAARDLARSKLWLAGALIGGSLSLGSLATLIRLVQDGFVRLAERPAVPVAPPPPFAAIGAASRELPAEPKPQPKPKPEPELEPALLRGPESAPGPREPRFDRLRPSEAPPARREPKFLPDA